MRADSSRIQTRVDRLIAARTRFQLGAYPIIQGLGIATSQPGSRARSIPAVRTARITCTGQCKDWPEEGLQNPLIARIAASRRSWH